MIYWQRRVNDYFLSIYNVLCLLSKHRILLSCIVFISYFYSVNEKRRRTSRVCSNYCMLLYGHNVYQYLISFYMQSGCNILCVLIYYSRVCSIMKLKHSRSQSHLMVNNRKYQAQGGWGWMGIPLVYLYPILNISFSKLNNHQSKINKKHKKTRGKNVEP